MALKEQLVNYYVEIVAFAFFLLAVAKMIVIIYSEPLNSFWNYTIIGLVALFFMNYKNLPFHAGKLIGRKKAA